MNLVGAPFWRTFDFTRPDAAPFRRADGVVEIAPAGEPRFDHDPAGRPIGLLVGSGDRVGAGDRVTCDRDSGWADHPEMTVLHAVLRDGAIERRAHYTRNAAGTVDSCLAIAGHHQLIGAVPGFLANEGGVVRYAGHDWLSAGYLAESGQVFASASPGGPAPLIAS